MSSGRRVILLWNMGRGRSSFPNGRRKSCRRWANGDEDTLVLGSVVATVAFALAGVVRDGWGDQCLWSGGAADAVAGSNGGGESFGQGGRSTAVVLGVWCAF